MESSTVEGSDSSTPRFRLDPTALTRSFFAEADSGFIDTTDLESLNREAQAHNGPARFCLHPSPKSDLHSMVIVQPASTYARPRKHLRRAKLFHLIAGQMIVVAFDDQGTVLATHHLSDTGVVVVRIEPNAFHSNLSVSPLATYHEIIAGPFVRDSPDRVFATFAPAEDEPQAGLTYLRGLITQFDEQTPGKAGR